MLEVRDSLRPHACKGSVRQPLKAKESKTKLFLEKATSASSRTSCPWNCQHPPVHAADALGIVVEDAAE